MLRDGIRPGNYPFFHEGQQSAKMQEEQNRRYRLLYDQKRGAELDKLKRMGLSVRKLPMYPLMKSRVTLCIEMSNAEQLQSRSSANDGLAAILKETNALIRLPDKEGTPPELMNQIIISGEVNDVEKVRQKIRAMTRVCLTLPLLTVEKVKLSNMREWLEKAHREGILYFPMLTITLQQAQPVIEITGREEDEEQIVKASQILVSELYCPEYHEKVSFVSSIDVPMVHRSLLVGNPDGALMVIISKETKANVHFPVFNNERANKLTLICSGSPASVLLARRIILGLLPVQLCYDVEDWAGSMAHIRRCAYWLPEFNSTVRVDKSELEPKDLLPGEPLRHFMCICTNEHNVAPMYALASRSLPYFTPPLIPQSVLSPTIRPLIFSYVGAIYAKNRIHPSMMNAIEEEHVRPVATAGAPYSEGEREEAEAPDGRRDRSQPPAPPGAFKHSLTYTSSNYSRNRNKDLRIKEIHKHTLELRPRNERNEKTPDRRSDHAERRGDHAERRGDHAERRDHAQHVERRAEHAERRSEDRRDMLSLKPRAPVQGSEGSEEEPRPRGSYAEILQQKIPDIRSASPSLTLFRMDPLKLIQLFGETPKKEETTYADVARRPGRDGSSSVPPSPTDADVTRRPRDGASSAPPCPTDEQQP